MVGHNRELPSSFGGLSVEELNNRVRGTKAFQEMDAFFRGIRDLPFEEHGKALDQKIQELGLDLDAIGLE